MVVYQIHRLSCDIVDLLTSVCVRLRSGVEIYALDVGQVTSEPDIVLVIKGWQGGDERQKIGNVPCVAGTPRLGQERR